MAQNLQEFLADLGEGRVQSRGSFTLSEDRASELLESYSLVDPGLYVVELVAAAVASGAEYCEINSGTRGCTVRFDGEPFTSEQVEQSGALVYAGSGTARSRSLSLALTAARSLAGEHLMVRVADARLHWGGEGWERKPLETPSGYTEVELKQPLQLLSAWMGSIKKLKEMLQVCRLAPLKLRFNGEEIYGFFWPEGYGSATCGCLQLQGPYPRPSLRSYNGFEHHVEAAEGQNFSASIFAVPPREAAQTGLTVVLNGVAYRGDGEPLDNPCLCGAVLTGELKTNLSRTGVVQDQAFLDLVSVLKRYSQDLLVELITGPLAFTKPLLELVPGVEHLREQFQVTADPRLDLVEEWLQSIEERDQELARGLEALQQEADLLERSGQERQAEALRLRLLERQLEALSKYTYDQERALVTGCGLAWTLEHLEPEGYRVRQVHEFATLCRCYSFDGESFSSDEVPTDLPQHSRALVARLRGLPSLAEEVYLESQSRESVRCRAELFMAAGDYPAAEKLLMANLALDSVDDLIPGCWAGENEDLDLMADLLELQGRFRQSLAFRKCLFEGYVPSSLLYLRRLEVARAAEGKTPFIEWVAYRSQASIAAFSASIGGWRQPLPRLLKKLWTRGIVPEESKLWAELAEFFKTNYLWVDLLKFLAARLAQRYRLLHQPEMGEALLARAGILVRIAKLRDLLRRGQPE